MKILIIEDDYMIIELIKRILKTAGIRFDTAETGGQGIEKFDNDYFDIIITDLFIPGTDGNGVARHIRKSNRPEVPIIGISASIDLFESDLFDCIISKPFPIQSLLNNVLNLSPQNSCAA